MGSDNGAYSAPSQLELKLSYVTYRGTCSTLLLLSSTQTVIPSLVQSQAITWTISSIRLLLTEICVETCNVSFMQIHLKLLPTKWHYTLFTDLFFASWWWIMFPYNMSFGMYNSSLINWPMLFEGAWGSVKATGSLSNLCQTMSAGVFYGEYIREDVTLLNFDEAKGSSISCMLVPHQIWPTYYYTPRNEV